MMIDSTDLIRKLPAMIQGRKTFAKMADGVNYHVGKPEEWCLRFIEVVTAIEDYCDYKQTGRFSLSAPVDGNWNVMNAYPYNKPDSETASGIVKERRLMACICERTVILEPNGDWDCLKNEEGIAVKESVQLACGHDEDGFYLTATGYDEEADWHPFFCPICGRKLRPNDATFQTIKGRYWENYDHRR